MVELIVASLVKITVAVSTEVATGGFTVKVKVCSEVTELLSVTVTVSIVAVQVSVGVPEIKPVAGLIVNPAGRVVTEYV